MPLKITIKNATSSAVEPVMALFLQEKTNKHGDVVVHLSAEDAYGRIHDLGWFDDKGLHLCRISAKDTGWPLDSDGYIKVVN